MKILLLGTDGQVGWELQRSLAPLGELIVMGVDSATNPGGLCGDFTQLDALADTVRQVRPDVIVNAAAHTAVDKAESEPEFARLLNALAPTPPCPRRRPAPATAPLSVYGQTKLEGEQAVMRCERHLIFRTSWVYAARGGNFAKTMLRLAQERETLQVIDDQLGAPTGADLIADVTAHALRQIKPCQGDGDVALAGIYHLVASGCTNWNAYAKHVVALAKSTQPAIKIIVNEIKAVPTSAFPTAAKRPHNSRLDTTKLQTTFGLVLPQWQAGVNRMLNEIDYGRTH